MKETQIEKPSDVINLAEETSKGFDESDKLSARLDRYSTAKRRALENLEQLKVLSVERVALPLDITAERYLKASALLLSCGNYLKFNNYYTVGKVRLTHASFCKQHLICPLCAIRRGAKTLDAYLKRYAVIRLEHPSWRLSMITLTVKNGDDLAERFKHLNSAVKRIFERRRDWLKKNRGLTEWRKVHGWVGTYEVTNKGQGWHPHAHLMVLHSENFDYKAMQSEWKDITQDSHVLNVSAAHHPDEPELDFLEVFKYAVKFSDLTTLDNIHAWEVLRGRRLLFSGGAFRGVEIPEDLHDECLDDLPYIELLYRYTVYGYSLESSLIKESSKT